VVFGEEFDGEGHGRWRGGEDEYMFLLRRGTQSQPSTMIIYARKL
jgi:hypothetical protein